MQLYSTAGSTSLKAALGGVTRDCLSSPSSFMRPSATASPWAPCLDPIPAVCSPGRCFQAAPGPRGSWQGSAHARPGCHSTCRPLRLSLQGSCFVQRRPWSALPWSQLSGRGGISPSARGRGSPSQEHPRQARSDKTAGAGSGLPRVRVPAPSPACRCPWAPLRACRFLSVRQDPHDSCLLMICCAFK